MERKCFEFEIKELTDSGQLTGYLSTFGNVDEGGDIVEKGAFRKTLREKKTFPLLWSHNASLPDLVVGTFSGKETDVGLEIKAEFFDDDDSQKVRRKVARLIERGVRVGLSIGYRTIKQKFDEIAGRTVRRLQEVALDEGSLTLFPMNQQALVQSVKSLNELLEKIDREISLGVEELKPYPNEHSCRLNDPNKYTRFRRITRKHDGKTYSIIIGFKPGGGSEEQAYRYPKDEWSEEEARAHCKEHDGVFEPASEKGLIVTCSSCDESVKLEEQKEEWDVAYINSLPDEAFAVIEPAYSRGDTEDKRARHLPHHKKGVTSATDDDSVDLPHLRNALARMNQIKPVTDSISASELRERAAKHLIGHAKRIGIGDYASYEAFMHLSEEPSPKDTQADKPQNNEPGEKAHSEVLAALQRVANELKKLTEDLNGKRT